MIKQKVIKLFHNDGWGYEIEQTGDSIDIRYFNRMEERNSKSPDDRFEIINMKEVLQDLGEAFLEFAQDAEY